MTDNKQDETELSFEELQKRADSFAEKLKSTFDAAADFGFRLTPCRMPEKVWSSKFQKDFLTMLDTLPDGVFEFSEELDAVAVSSNVGVISTLADWDNRIQYVSCNAVSAILRQNHGFCQAVGR